MGYVYDGTIAPKYWMHFADDTALVTPLESDNQYLCNAKFVKWSTWAGLIIKVSKRHVFGMKKVKTDINYILQSTKHQFQQLKYRRTLLT